MSRLFFYDIIMTRSFWNFYFLFSKFHRVYSTYLVFFFFFLLYFSSSMSKISCKNCAINTTDFSLAYLNRARQTSRIYASTVLCKFPTASYDHYDKYVLTRQEWILTFQTERIIIASTVGQHHQLSPFHSPRISSSWKVLTSLIPLADLMGFFPSPSNGEIFLTTFPRHDTYIPS